MSEAPVELVSVFQDPNFDPFVDVQPIAVPHFDYSEPALAVAGVSSPAVDVPASAPEPAAQTWTAPTPAPAQSASPEGV